MQQQSFKPRVGLFIFLILSLTLLNSIFVVWPLMEVQAGPTLPPRDDTAAATDDDDDDSSGRPVVAYIELFVSPTPVGVEGVVQWQDINGDWNDVEGWKRTLQSGYEHWTVEAKDFNSGPFRWVVRHGQSGLVVGSSESFNLPAGAGQIQQVTIVTE